MGFPTVVQSSTVNGGSWQSHCSQTQPLPSWTTVVQCIYMYYKVALTLCLQSSSAVLQVWNLSNMLPIIALQRHEKAVHAMAVWQDSVFTGAEDMEIKVGL